MANNYIAINTTGLRHASSLMGAINNLANARDQLVLLKQVMDQMTDGVTFTTLEQAFGVPAGKGQSVYNLVAGAASEVYGTNTSQLINWLGAVR